METTSIVLHELVSERRRSGGGSGDEDGGGVGVWSDALGSVDDNDGGEYLEVDVVEDAGGTSSQSEASESSESESESESEAIVQQVVETNV